MCQIRKISLVLLLITLNTTFAVRREKRHLINFKKMIECVTGRSAEDFIGYGCYCGKGGNGTAVDAIDRCCEQHDQCYRRARLETDCRTKTDWYAWRCLVDSVVRFKTEETARCNDADNHLCEKAICQCDMAAAKCFANVTYPSEKPKCLDKTSTIDKWVNKASEIVLKAGEKVKNNLKKWFG